MKNKLFPLLVLGSALVVTGCSGGSSGADRTYVATATDMKLNYVSLNLGRGESAQIKTTFTPLRAYGSKMRYVSSNPNAISVNENGLISAKGYGKSEITVGVLNSKGEVYLSKKLNVFCLATAPVASQEAYFNDMAAQQDAHAAVNNIRVYDHTERTYYRNGEVYTHSTTDLKMVTSLSDAFFEYTVQYHDSITPDGAPDTSSVSFIYFVSEDYETHAYVNRGGIKKRATLATESYMSKPNGRLQAVYDLLDNELSLGHKAFTDNYDEVKGKESVADTLREYSELTSYLKNVDAKVGSDGKVELLRVKWGFDDVDSTIEDDQEDQTNIPARKDIKFGIDRDYIFEDGLVSHFEYYQVMKYELDGAQWEYVVEFTQSFEVDNFTLEYPVKKDYSLVDFSEL